MEWSTEELKESYGQLLNDWSECRKNFKKWESYYERTYSNGLEGTQSAPSAYDHIVKPPTPMWIIESPVNYMAMDSIKLGQEVKLSGPNATVARGDQKKSDNVGAFCQNLVTAWTDVPPYFLRTSIFDMALRGGGCYLTTVKPEVKTKEDYVGPPFNLDALDPNYILCSLDLDDFGCPNLLFRERLMKYSDLLYRVQKWNKKEIPIFPSAKKSDSVVLLEWWLEKQRGYLAAPYDQGNMETTLNGIQAVPYQGNKSFDNAYGFVPFTLGFSGRGRMPQGCQPHKMFKSQLYGLDDTVMQQSRNESRFDTIAGYLSFPDDQWEIQQGTQLSPDQLRRKPGVPLVVYTGQRHTQLPMRQIPDALMKQHDRTERQLEWVLPGVTRGVAQPGEAASAMNMRLVQATQPYVGIQIGEVHMLQNALRNVLRTIENADLSVEFGGVRVEKKDINHHYAIKVRIQSGNPEEQLRRQEQGKGLMGLLSPQRILEDYEGVDNATNEIIETAAWDFFKAITTNLNNPIAAVVAQMVGESLKLKLQAEGLIAIPPVTPSAVPPPTAPANTSTGAGQEIRPSEGNPAVNGNLTTGLVPISTARSPATPSDNLQRFRELMNARVATRAG